MKPTPKEIKEIKEFMFSRKTSLSASLLSVRRDLSDFHNAKIKCYVINSYMQLNYKQFLSSIRYQRPYRHMWE